MHSMLIEFFAMLYNASFFFLVPVAYWCLYAWWADREAKAIKEIGEMQSKHPLNIRAEQSRMYRRTGIVALIGFLVLLAAETFVMANAHAIIRAAVRINGFD